jgi:GH15 family glucan-1,4-alpha-glucosidase
MVNKGLPKEILESFSKNYIDQSVFDPNRSVLDRIGVTNGQQQVTETVQTYQPVQPIQQNVGGSVDYELIKTIVESAVKKYVNALGKKVLTENNDLNMIQVGEKKINLVTKSGDIYEAQLKFVKNINKK